MCVQYQTARCRYPIVSVCICLPLPTPPVFPLATHHHSHQPLPGPCLFSPPSPPHTPTHPPTPLQAVKSSSSLRVLSVSQSCLSVAAARRLTTTIAELACPKAPPSLACNLNVSHLSNSTDCVCSSCFSPLVLPCCVTVVKFTSHQQHDTHCHTQHNTTRHLPFTNASASVPVSASVSVSVSVFLLIVTTHPHNTHALCVHRWAHSLLRV